MMRKSKIFLPVLFFLLSAGNLFADPEYPKVLAVFGKAEILEPPNGWRKLESASSLKKGFKLRTGDKSSVEIVWDSELENMAMLDENAHLDILSQNPPRLFLMRGKFFVLREESASGDHEKTRLPMKFFTGDTLVEMKEGGCSIEAGKKETMVKVFSEKASIFSLKEHRVSSEGKSAEEGFKFFSGKMDPRISSRFQRMSYGDYADWQAWVRKSYEIKDDRAAKAFQEGIVL